MKDITAEENLMNNIRYVTATYEREMMSKRIKEGMRLKKLKLQQQDNKCVSYLRSATTQQNKGNSSSLEQQKKACMEYANKNGYEIIKAFSDNGVSGITKNRPAFKKMLQFCRKNKVKNIITANVDRISRSYKQYIEIMSHFAKKDVKVHFTNI